MLSAAKHLLFRAINNLKDSSSPAAPQNDTSAVFFNKLLNNKDNPVRPANIQTHSVYQNYDIQNAADCQEPAGQKARPVIHPRNGPLPNARRDMPW